MNLKPQTSLLAALLLSAAASLIAQPAAVSGHWEGSIRTPLTALAFEVDLAADSSGQLKGALAQPAENLKGLPLSDIAVDGKVVRFQIKGTPGERAFKGSLAADGKSISGTFMQNGESIPFEMARVGDAKLEAAVKNAPIDKELEGVWNGTLAASGKQLRAVLTLANQPDGGATGSIVTVDDGLEIPIGAITQRASSLTLDLPAVGASFSGTLNADATELAGTYAQGPLTASLTFRRAAAIEAKK
jgi:hypothetical protein